MTNKFFEKEVNIENRQEMVDFLVNHFRYFTMNSWNRSKSYAHNIKVCNLGIDNEETLNKAYDIIGQNVDKTEMYDEMQTAIYDFTSKTNFEIGFNGRSGGYIVLYYTELDENGQTRVFPGRNFGSNKPEYFDEWEDSEIKELVELVQEFDKLTDELREIFISYAENAEIVEEEEVIVNTKLVLTKGD